jgi:hypothetical protein
VALPGLVLGDAGCLDPPHANSQCQHDASKNRVVVVNDVDALYCVVHVMLGIEDSALILNKGEFEGKPPQEPLSTTKSMSDKSAFQTASEKDSRRGSNAVASLFV